MASTAVSISDTCLAAQRAARELATLGSEVKNDALGMADQRYIGIPRRLQTLDA